MAEKQFTTFYLGESLFGIDVLQVREINRDMNFTFVDRAPEYVSGLLNLRGQIVTVFDLGVKLGLGARVITDKTRCIVLKDNHELQKYRDAGIEIDNTSDDLVGILIDELVDMVDVEELDIEAPPANVNGVDSKYINGVIKLDHTLLVTLKTSSILSV